MPEAPGAEAIESPVRRHPTVFLSYASKDRPAARAIRDALMSFGFEVWYDENELDGGDAWDQKIRKQIRECDYFLPIVSATTDARHEGYFRREWRLAVERTLDMADDHTFLLPVVIDETDTARARVPEKFLAVQWLRVPGGRPTTALEALCRRLVTSEPAKKPPSSRSSGSVVGDSGISAGISTSVGSGASADSGTLVGAAASGGGVMADNTGSAAGVAPPPSNPSGSAPTTPIRVPEFPREEPGQRVRFWLEVIGWAIRTGRIYFQRLPRGVRWLVFGWLIITMMSRGCDSDDSRHDVKLSQAATEKLKAIADQYQGSSNTADIVKLGRQIASEFSDVSDDGAQRSAVLVIPFTVPAGDPAAARFADSTFAQVYGRVAISQHGRVRLSDKPLPSLDLAAALEQGNTIHSTYVVCGVVSTEAAQQMLTVEVAKVGDGSVVWSKSYPATEADPVKIATEVAAKVPSEDDD